MSPREQLQSITEEYNYASAREDCRIFGKAQEEKIRQEEREACAVIAESYDGATESVRRACETIARAIRERK
jgi:hypothetical protein